MMPMMAPPQMPDGKDGATLTPQQQQQMLYEQQQLIYQQMAMHQHLYNQY